MTLGLEVRGLNSAVAVASCETNCFVPQFFICKMGVATVPNLHSVRSK